MNVSFYLTCGNGLLKSLIRPLFMENFEEINCRIIKKNLRVRKQGLSRQYKVYTVFTCESPFEEIIHYKRSLMTPIKSFVFGFM